MQDVDRSLEPRDIDHPKRTLTLSDADLAHTRTDGPDRLPIIGFTAALHLIQLAPGFSTRTLRKRLQIIERRENATAKP
jgi:hypothetical protein